jgi:hypothetical protein
MNPKEFHGVQFFVQKSIYIYRWFSYRIVIFQNHYGFPLFQKEPSVF